MERQWSLEDYNIANSMWKLGAGFPRTDSENAFQDFLKRIPSTTNLAAQAGQHLDQQQQAQFHQQVQHLQQQSAQQQAAYPSGAGIPGNAGDMQPGAGIPRVPSLDFLRQLVGHQFNPAQFSPSPAVVPKQEAPQPEVKAPEVSQPQPQAAPEPGPAAPAAPSYSTDISNPPPRVPNVSSGFNPAVAAAAIQLGQLQQLQQFGRPQGQDQLDKESVAKAEVRRARRMLSNRESARRSRRRKQEHLSTLEDQLNDMQRDKDELFERLQRVEGGAAERERELHRLRQENAALKHQLEDGKRPASAQKGIPRTGSWQHIPVEEQPPRKRLLTQADRDSPLERMVVPEVPEHPVPEPQQPMPVSAPAPALMPATSGLDQDSGQLDGLPQQAPFPSDQPALDDREQN